MRTEQEVKSSHRLRKPAATRRMGLLEIELISSGERKAQTQTFPVFAIN
jgi:hypothetical protein